MNTSCENCRNLPEGIEGHAGLFTHRLSGSQMQFKCRSCGALWTRTSKAGGAYAWAPSEEGQVGIAAPGRVS